MVKKDKNGNEPGLSLQRNYQKEPPKKIILKDRSELSIHINQLPCIKYIGGRTVSESGIHLIT